eukprot:2937763-Pleurochrysis_carterae.AAC.1
MEFYLYLDASKFGDDLWSLTQQHWSALWAFGHGEGDFGWPSSGEWDILEWLPRFDANGALGATSGFHNAVTGASSRHSMRATHSVRSYRPVC